MTDNDKHAEHMAMNAKAWDAYHLAYMHLHLAAHPDHFGAWQGPENPTAGFCHPTWRIVNAILDAGYQLVRMEEPTRVAGEEQPRDLPNGLYLLARKPGP